jgi:hypothetical protein
MNQQTRTSAGQGATHGSDTRPARELGSEQVLDLMAEATTLFDEPEWAERDRNSRTIAATDGLRITLTALRSGATIGSEGNDDTLSVHVLRGAVSAALSGTEARVAAGQLATMSQPGPWLLTASDDALLLLTVAVASGQDARGIDGEHAATGTAIEGLGATGSPPADRT